MIKLDAYDTKILEELLKNSRQSTTSLSKKIKLSRENIDYRIKKLLKEKIIN